MGAVFFPCTVTGCSISSSQIKAFYGTGDGLWRIQLAWSGDNPDCKVHLEEQVDGKEKFQIVDSKECRLLYSIHTIIDLQAKTTQDFENILFKNVIDGPDFLTSDFTQESFQSNTGNFFGIMFGIV